MKPNALSKFKRHAPWALTWCVVSLIDAMLRARAELARLRDAFETHASIAHRLLSQTAAQHDAVLSTLALLRPPDESARPAQRLPSSQEGVYRLPTDWVLPGLLCLGVILSLMAAPTARAQVPPTPSEAAQYTGLHAAAHLGDVANIEKLVASKSDVNARDRVGRTPLHLATFARQRDAIRALAKAGARLELLENDRYDAVTIAAVADDDETLRVLLSLGASAKLTTSRYDGTALIAAAHLGHDGVVKQLIAAGAPLDHVNNLHWTALIESIVLGNGGPRHQEVLRALLAAGASTRLADRQGTTPLALARSRGYAAMVQMLERAGAR